MGQSDQHLWSMLKRGYHGTLQKMSPKHLNRYVREFSGRHTVREADTVDQMEHFAVGIEGKRLTYKQLIADYGRESGAKAASLNSI